jgi:hypothetical protein
MGLAFSPDGSLLASISADNQVRLWRAAAADPTVTVANTKAPARSPATSPVGKEPARALPTPVKSVPAAVIVPIWLLEVADPAKVRATQEGNALRVEVTEVDATDVPTMFMQVQPLQEGATYTLRFRARADRPRRMKLTGQIAQPDFHIIGLAEKVPLTQEWRTYRYVFTAKNVAPQNGVPNFLLGQETGTVWLADVSLIKGVR